MKTSCSCHNSSKPTLKNKGLSGLNIISAIVFFLFPKCPICWAAYASFFSFIGLDTLSYNPSWKYALFAIFSIGSLFLLWKHYKQRAWINIIVYSSGLAIFAITYLLNTSQNWWLYIVVILMLLSNLYWNAKSLKLWSRL
ncbi:hypothetical protein [Aquimarina rhabdastrellae]